MKKEDIIDFYEVNRWKVSILFAHFVLPKGNKLFATQIFAMFWVSISMPHGLLEKRKDEEATYPRKFVKSNLRENVLLVHFSPRVKWFLENISWDLADFVKTFTLFSMVLARDSETSLFWTYWRSKTSPGVTS